MVATTEGVEESPYKDCAPGFAFIGPIVCLLTLCTLKVGTPAEANSN